MRHNRQGGGPSRASRSRGSSAPQSAPPARPPAAPASRPGTRRDQPQGQHWLYGKHAVVAALLNPARHVARLLAMTEAAQRLLAELQHEPRARSIVETAEIVRREEIARRLPADAVHQGLAALAAPLPETFLTDLIGAADDQSVIVVLDQVTDPHNVGAILRSADAFGAAGIVSTDRHTAEETGTLAKAASGALERIPLVRVPNLARALRELKDGGFWIAGLSERGTEALAAAKLSGRIAIVLGAEGDGMRHLTEQHCDLLLRLPLRGAMPSLNVSNAAAIALYELARSR